MGRGSIIPLPLLDLYILIALSDKVELMSRGFIGIPPPQSISDSSSSCRLFEHADEQIEPEDAQLRDSKVGPKVEHSAPEPVGNRNTGLDRVSKPNVDPQVEIQLENGSKRPILQSRFSE